MAFNDQKKQQQEGDHNNFDYKAKDGRMGEVKDVTSHKGGNDYNANVDKIVGNEYVGQQPFGLVQQVQHQGLFAGGMLLQIVDMLRPQAEIGHLRSGDHG